MKVRLYLRIRLANGNRQFIDPVYAANGKLKPLYALVDGNAEHHPEGVYYLRYLKHGKRVWEYVGTDAPSAMTARLKRERILAAQAAGVEIPDENKAQQQSGRDLNESIVEYLGEVKIGKSHKTYLAYGMTLREFARDCNSKAMEELNRTDVLAYIGALRERGITPRTIANRVAFLKTFFLHYELAWPLLKTDRVRYTEKTVEAYSAEELQSLFAAANQEETDLFQFLLCTGVREQEAMHATWRDLNFSNRTFKVREKLAMGFTPKDKEEGTIPIPDSLVALLQARRKRNPDSRLIFPGPDGGPNGHFLRILQRRAFLAGLNCGECFSKKGQCCSTKPICHYWGLHRFRKTFATMHHEAGVPVRTIQRWLRHSSLDTTLRYLAGSDDRSERIRAQVNGTFAGLQPDSTTTLSKAGSQAAA